MNKKLPGETINANYKRTPDEWMDILLTCLNELSENIVEMEDLSMTNKDYIVRSVFHIKRFYSELEKEFFRNHNTPQNASKTTKSNITIKF